MSVLLCLSMHVVYICHNYFLEILKNFQACHLHLNASQLYSVNMWQQEVKFQMSLNFSASLHSIFKLRKMSFESEILELAFLWQILPNESYLLLLAWLICVHQPKPEKNWMLERWEEKKRRKVSVVFSYYFKWISTMHQANMWFKQVLGSWTEGSP